MDRNLVEGTVDDVSAKPIWAAPQIIETDIDAITAAGSGTGGDGVTTSS